MAQVGMGGYQAIGSIYINSSSHGSGPNAYVIPENCFAIGVLACVANNFTDPSESVILQRVAPADGERFSLILPVIYMGDVSDVPQFNYSSQQLYLPAGSYVLTAFSGVANFGGVLFKNTPLVNN